MLDLLFFEFHRAACEVKYYLKEFYVEAEFAFAAVAEKAIFAFAAIADKAIFAFTAVAEKALFAFAAIADEAIFAFAAVTDEAIFAFTAVADEAIFAFTAVADEAIFAAGEGLYAFLACIAIFTIAAIALGANWSFTVGSEYNDVVVFVVIVMRVLVRRLYGVGSGFVFT